MALPLSLPASLPCFRNHLLVIARVVAIPVAMFCRRRHRHRHRHRRSRCHDGCHLSGGVSRAYVLDLDNVYISTCDIMKMAFTFCKFWTVAEVMIAASNNSTVDPSSFLWRGVCLRELTCLVLIQRVQFACFNSEANCNQNIWIGEKKQQHHQVRSVKADNASVDNGAKQTLM